METVFPVMACIINPGIFLLYLGKSRLIKSEKSWVEPGLRTAPLIGRFKHLYFHPNQGKWCKLTKCFKWVGSTTNHTSFAPPLGPIKWEICFHTPNQTRLFKKSSTSFEQANVPSSGAYTGSWNGTHFGENQKIHKFMVIFGGNFPQKTGANCLSWCHPSWPPTTTTPLTQSSALKRQVLGGQVQLALHTGNRVADPRLGFGAPNPPPKWWNS